MNGKTIASGAWFCDSCDRVKVAPWVAYEIYCHKLGLFEMHDSTKRILGMIK